MNHLERDKIKSNITKRDEEVVAKKKVPSTRKASIISSSAHKPAADRQNALLLPSSERCWLIAATSGAAGWQGLAQRQAHDEQQSAQPLPAPVWDPAVHREVGERHRIPRAGT